MNTRVRVIASVAIPSVYAEVQQIRIRHPGRLGHDLRLPAFPKQLRGVSGLHCEPNAHHYLGPPSPAAGHTGFAITQRLG